MKRSELLIEFSREHHRALVLARRLRRIPLTDAQQVARALQQTCELFQAELEPHFQAEEQTLFPALQPLAGASMIERALADHATLRHLAQRLVEKDATALPIFAEALEAHVRFEERELFDLADAQASDQAG